MDKQNRGKMLKIVALLLIVLGVVLLLFSPEKFEYIKICGGVGILVGIVVLIYWRRQCCKYDSEKLKERINNTLDPQKDEHNRIEAYADELCKLNLSLRLERGVPHVIVNRCEGMIDQLLRIIPKALDKMIRSETTFELVRLAESYLPGLLRQYLELSETGRKKHEEGLINQLDELLKYITDVAGKLDKGQAQEFDRASGFLKTRFSQV